MVCEPPSLQTEDGGPAALNSWGGCEKVRVNCSPQYFANSDSPELSSP